MRKFSARLDSREKINKACDNDDEELISKKELTGDKWANGTRKNNRKLTVGNGKLMLET